MNWKPHLPEIFLGISLGMIALEAALTRVAIIKARYRARDTFASLGMQTFNPIRIAFHEWAAITRELFAARSVREAAGAVFGPPGWRAEGQGLTSKNIRADWEAHHG